MKIIKNKKRRLAKPQALKAFLQDAALQTVLVKYELTTTHNVAVRSMFIGYTEIDLVEDQDTTNRDIFKTTADKAYSCILRPEGLSVVVFASGMAGDSWSLKILVRTPDATDYKAIKDHPIKVSVDNMGHLDHNKFHQII